MAGRPWNAGGDTAADRLARQLAGEFSRGQAGFSRRSFLRASGVGAMALGAGGLLAACGTEGTKQTADTCKSTDLSSSQKELIFSNWPLYMDEDGKKYPTLEVFQKDSGI